MPELFGTNYSRSDLQRRIGRLDQVAGIRLMTLGDAGARGVRVLEFRTGSGFSFDVLVDRAFDIGRCELRGMPLAWTSAVGVEGPWFYEPEGLGFFRGFGGGLLTTCGIDHAVGFLIHVKPGSAVRTGGLLATILARDATTLAAAREALGRAIVIGESAPPARPRISHRVTSGGVEELPGAGASW